VRRAWTERLRFPASWGCPAATLCILSLLSASLLSAEEFLRCEAGAQLVRLDLDTIGRDREEPAGA
jgi:hypothetical protein